MKKFLPFAVAFNVCFLIEAQGQLPSWESSPEFGEMKGDSLQKFSGDVQQAWVARHNEQGHARDRMTAMVRDRAGNIYVTGNAGTVKYNSSGVRQWVAKGSGNVLAVDDTGNVYVAGQRWGVNSKDYLTRKYNTAGIQQWEATYNGPKNMGDFPRSIIVDAAGNVYVAGTNEGGMIDSITTVKYNSIGVLQWAVQGPGGAIGVDNAGNLYMAGTRLRKNTSNDYSIVKYNSVGMQQWEAKYNGPANGDDFTKAIVVKDSNAIYVTGRSWNGASFNYTTVKYNSAGTLKWVAAYKGESHDYSEAQSVIVDDAGNFYVAGRSRRWPIDNYFVIKYNSAGVFKWVQTLMAEGNTPYPVALAVDAAGNVYLAGINWRVKTAHDYIIAKYDAAGSRVWSKSYNGPGNDDDHPVALAVDKAGNFYVGGSSHGAGTSSDYTISKYDAGGLIRWIVRHDEPAPAHDIAKAMRVDGVGNIYITGYSYGFHGLVYGAFTIKYDAAGSRKWVAHAPYKTQGSDRSQALAIDAAGNVYITGFCGTVKYNSAGARKWAANIFGKAIAVDGAGNVYVAAVMDGQMNDYATVKYNSAGEEQWSARYNGPENRNDNVSALAVDNAGNVYVTGATGNEGDPDYATVKYNSVGEKQWVARYNSPKNNGDRPTAIAVDGKGNVYVTGVGDYGANFTIKYNSAGSQQWLAQGLGDLLSVDDKGNVFVTRIKSNGRNSDYATVKYNTAGVQEWMANFDGPGNSFDDPNALALDDAGNVYVTGTSWNSETSIKSYATVKYNSAGDQQWMVNYNIPKYNSLPLPALLGVDAVGNVYVAGSIDNPGTGYDFVTIKYKQSAAKKSKVEKSEVAKSKVVTSYELTQNYPNPFSLLEREIFGNASTMINFSLPETGSVMVNIYSETGQLVRTLVDRELAAGRHQLSWNGRNQFGNAVAAGVYFCRMTATGKNGATAFSKTQRMTLVK